LILLILFSVFLPLGMRSEVDRPQTLSVIMSPEVNAHPSPFAKKSLGQALEV